jgi:hypothetical protein
MLRVEAPARVAKAGCDVFQLEVGKLFDNLRRGETCGQKIQAVAHANPQSTSARPPAAFPGIDRDALGELSHAVLLSDDE